MYQKVEDNFSHFSSQSLHIGKENNEKKVLTESYYENSNNVQNNWQ